MSKHALAWTAYRRLRDQADRTHSGRHARNASLTHQPAWPFNRSAA